MVGRLSSIVCRLSPSRCRRSVIVNYLPALFCLPEDQRESTVRFIFRTFQSPTAQYNGNVIAHWSDLQIGKGERAHLLSRVITLLVSIEHRLPAMSHAVAGNKDRIGRTRV